MKITYSTNAWGKIYAHAGATNNVNNAFYVTDGEAETAIREIAEAGFESIEMFDGDLLKYDNEVDKLKKILVAHEVSLKGVYSAGCFIFDDILDEEIFRIKRTAKIAKELGADQLVLGGGATRSDGINEEDYKKLGKALDRIADIAAEMGMTASYHPHLGSLVETPEQIDSVMASSKICLCPDTGHIYLGGGDPYEVTKKYIHRIKYFHLKGVESDGSFCAPSKGVIDIKPILTLLSQHKGKISLAVETDGSKRAPSMDAKETAQFLSSFLQL